MPALALVTPPATEPVTLAEARAWLRLDTAADDPAVTALISASRQAAEEHLRRSLLTQTWGLTLDLTCDRERWWDGVRDGAVTALHGALPRVIPLPRGPVQAVSSVTTYDLGNTATSYPATNYRLAADDRLALASGASWPARMRPEAGCEITYTAGYGSPAQVPQAIRTGLLIHLASLYEQRGLCDDAVKLPPGAAQLYAPYRVMDRRG